MQVRRSFSQVKKKFVELLLLADLQLPYSENKLLLFEAYIKEKRWYTTPTYCLLPMSFVLIYQLLLMCSFSLQPISKGYLASGALPLMNIVGATGSCLSIISVFIHFFPEESYNKWKVLGVAAIGGIVFVAIAALLSEICFPFPFAGLIPVNVVAPLVIALSCYVWVPHCRSLPHFKKTIISYLAVILCLWAVTMLYPAVLVLFHGMEYGPIFICLSLSLVRKGYESLIIYCCNYCNRSAAFLAVFLCTGFNVVYLSTTLQTGMSTFNLLAIMAIDILINMHSIWQLIYLQSLAENEICNPKGEGKQRDTVFSPAAVNKSPIVIPDGGRAPQPKGKKELATRNITRHLLPYAEIFILTEYVECVVPLLMAVFSYALYYHPNGKYIPNVSSLSLEELHASIFQLTVYGLGEIVGFVLFLAAIDYKFPISPWAHLGCILKHKCYIVSIYLSTWVAYSFSQVLLHTASDWTFQFECNPAP